MLRHLLSAVAATLISTSLLSASAITAVQTVEQMIVETLEDGSQQVRFVKADRVKPGEEVIYRLSYENDRDEAAANVALVMPVPDDVIFIEGSADEPGTVVTYSTDNGETFGDMTDEAPASITHIRWQFEDAIAPQSKGDILFRATLK